MAITLDATAAGASSNAYCTLAEAETYMESRLHKASWTAATDANKNAAIAWATRILDEELDWDGSIYSSTQSLRWPRIGVYTRDGYAISDSTIPQFLKNATAEFALKLIEEDRTTDYSMAGLKKIVIEGAVQLTADKSIRKPSIPESVYNMVSFCSVRSSKRARFLTRV
jgi:hypothetical protein